MRKKAIAVMLLVTLGLTACNGGNPDIDEAYSDLQSDVGTGTESTVDEVRTTIPDTLEYTIVSDSGANDFKVAAKVVSDGYENAACYEIELCDMNEEFLNRLATSLFDDGKYTIEKPYVVCTQEELNDLQQEYAEALEIDDYFTYPEAVVEIESLLQQPDDARSRDMQDGQMIVTLDDPNLTYRLGRDKIQLMGDVALLQGTIDGKQYQLSYGENQYGATLKVRTMDHQTMSDSIFNMESTMFEENEGDNTCDVDESQKIADQIMERIGYDDFDVFSIGKRRCRRQDQSSYMGGYVFNYTRVLDTFPSVISDNICVVTMDMTQNGTDSYYGQEYVTVKVDETGFIGMDFYYPYKLTGKSSGGQLLDFAEVDEIAQKAIVDLMNRVENEDPLLTAYTSRIFALPDDIKQVRFTYVPECTDGKFSYVPTWIYLCDYQTDNPNILSHSFALVGVDAIDGSVMYFNYAIPFRVCDFSYMY